MLSTPTTVFHNKKVFHRVCAYFRARVAWTMAVSHLSPRCGLEIDNQNMVPLSIAEFYLKGALLDIALGTG